MICLCVSCGGLGCREVPKGTGKSRSCDRHERGVGFVFSPSLRKVPERHGRLRSDRERDVAQTTRVTFFYQTTRELMVHEFGRSCKYKSGGKRDLSAPCFRSVSRDSHPRALPACPPSLCGGLCHNADVRPLISHFAGFAPGAWPPAGPLAAGPRVALDFGQTNTRRDFAMWFVLYAREDCKKNGRFRVLLLFA